MMKKSSSSSLEGSFPSPGAPYYRSDNRTTTIDVIGSQKGWSSERVSISRRESGATNISRRHTMAGLSPFCGGGRTLPSKWDEAERWICSPVSAAYAESSRRNSLHATPGATAQRRPKSISGPIAPPPAPGVAAFYSSYSPLHSGGLVVRNLVVGSPFSTGVLAPVAVSVHHFDNSHAHAHAHDHDHDHDHHGTVFGYDLLDTGMQFSSPVQKEMNGVVLSSFSPPVDATCPPLPCHQSSPISPDEKHDGTMEEEENVAASHSSRCDKGTQMSPGETENNDDSHYSSPKSCATSVVVDQQECHSSPKLEVRDVQVDSQATIIRWSKWHATKLAKKDTLHRKDSREIINAEAQAASWDIDESNIDTSKLQREEAKIIAWENLQKAKAETAIRKLEMKLEKKRSSTMDKILNKLRRAQLKAENMRSSMPVQQHHHQVSKCRVFSFSKYGQILWSPSSCFRSHDE